MWRVKMQQDDIAAAELRLLLKLCEKFRLSLRPRAFFLLFEYATLFGLLFHDRLRLLLAFEQCFGLSW